MAQPKYQLLQQWLRDQINSGEYTANQQIPTELELAEQFGYSRQTIRQAISGLEQEGLLKRTPGRGTFVCRQNAGRVNRSESRTRRVGVLTTYLDDYIFPGIINGIERVLSRHDYLFTLGLTHNKTLDEATALQKLLAAGVDGLIIEGTKTALPTPNEGILQSFRDAGIPMVFINGCYDGANDSYVLMDDVQSGELLTQHLIDRVHTQIGGIFKSDDIQGVKRYEGVVKGMQKNDGHIKDDCILWYTTEDVRYLFGRTLHGAGLQGLHPRTRTGDPPDGRKHQGHHLPPAVISIFQFRNMRIDILTVVPELLTSPLNESILHRAQEKGLVQIVVHNLHDYAHDRRKTTDDYPFGGEAGMVLKCEPVFELIEKLQSERHYDEIIYTSPDGVRYDQHEANRLSTLDNIIILCGHYKGIDHRIREHLVTREISIGDYVLTGGELAACIIADSVVRIIPGAIGDEV